ncbi:helix-turn-helix domain-containing protein [Cohnella cholangitidis]|uniref:Helix-turn-helix domain-containing protein n=1 Tax=Cohnella cholangitidis TaxID=2598458 RepID=A0A7G5BSS6_9BACL|nr:helix-turn-helix domain-containing protein [Cohnella cholangitidis]QMV40010.1 helix-turn-helix domain-containing protein [Cohnella cholangitidis]
MRNETMLLEDPLVLSWMRDSVLRNLVASPNAEIEEWQHKLIMLNLNCYFTAPSIALFECSGTLIDDIQRNKENERLQLFLTQHMPEGSILFKDGEDRVALLFSWEHFPLLRALNTRISLTASCPVNIGIGEPCMLLRDVHKSYVQALRALEAKFYQGTGQWILYSELNKAESLEDYPVLQEKELYHRVKSAKDITDMEQGIGLFYEHVIKNGPIEVNQIREVTLRMLVGMENKILGESRASLAKYEMVSIVKMETLGEIISFAAMYLLDRRERAKRDDQDSHRSIIKKTISYMEQECQIATLERMARKVYMTPTYLSMLFKANTGITFIEQLTNIRIDKAKALLSSTGLKNYEIAEKSVITIPDTLASYSKRRLVSRLANIGIPWRRDYRAGWIERE